jgi:hypothetical protein
MDMSPSWEAANCAATQELPNIWWNPKVHRRVHKSPPLFPILRQINPVNTTPSYLSNVHCNPPAYVLVFLVAWLLAFPPNYMHSSSPIRVTCPSHFIMLDFIILIILDEECKFRSSWLRRFFQPPVTSSLFCPNIHLSTLSSNTTSLCSSVNVTDHVSRP